MKRLFIRLAIFLAPLAVLLALVEYKLSKYANIDTVRSESLRQSADHVQILLVGNSHAMVGIDPSGLPLPAFNLAFSGQSTILDAKLATMLLTRLPRLRLLIVGVGYGSLRFRISEDAERWRNEVYRRALHVSEADDAVTDLVDPHRYSRYLAYGPAGLRGMLFGSASSTEPVVLDDAWQPLDSLMQADLSPRAAAVRAESHKSLMRSDVTDGIVQALRGLLSDASRHGVRVLFLTTPLSSTYRAQFLNGEWVADRGRIEALARSCSASYRDYSADPRFEPGDFSDVDHLNARGAKRFTRILAEEAVIPALSGATLPFTCR